MVLFTMCLCPPYFLRIGSERFHQIQAYSFTGQSVLSSGGTYVWQMLFWEGERHWCSMRSPIQSLVPVHGAGARWLTVSSCTPAQTLPCSGRLPPEWLLSSKCYLALGHQTPVKVTQYHVELGLINRRQHKFHLKRPRLGDVLGGQEAKLLSWWSPHSSPPTAIHCPSYSRCATHPCHSTLSPPSHSRDSSVILLRLGAMVEFHIAVCMGHSSSSDHPPHGHTPCPTDTTPLPTDTLPSMVKISSEMSLQRQRPSASGLSQQNQRPGRSSEMLPYPVSILTQSLGVEGNNVTTCILRP